MDAPQMYVFQGVQQMDRFLKENVADITVERIEIQPVPTQASFFFFVTAKVRVLMCDEIWRRYEKLIGVPTA